MDDNIQLRIDKAAQTLVFTFGSRGWSMDDCAKEAGVTKRTLYRYISSKEELIERTIINHIIETQTKLGKVVKKENDYLSGLDRLIIEFSKIINQLDSRILQTVFTDYPDLETTIIDKRTSLASVVTDYLCKGQTISLIRKDLNAVNILNVLQAIVLYNIKNGAPKDALQSEFSIVLKGILNECGNE